MLKYLTVVLFIAVITSQEIRQKNDGENVLLKKLFRRRRFSQGQCPFTTARNLCDPSYTLGFENLRRRVQPNLFELPATSIQAPVRQFNLPELGLGHTGPIFGADVIIPSSGRQSFTGTAILPDEGVSLTGSVSQTFSQKEPFQTATSDGITYNAGTNWQSKSGDSSVSLNVDHPPQQRIDVVLSGKTQISDGLTLKAEHSQPLAPNFRHDGPSTSTGTVEYSGGGLTGSLSGTHTPGQPDSNTAKIEYTNGAFGASVSQTNTAGLPATNTGKLEYNSPNFEASISTSKTERQPSSTVVDVKVPLTTISKGQGEIFVSGHSDLKKDNSVHVEGKINF